MADSSSNHLAGIPQMFVKPGHIFVTEAPTAISTVLAGGVATCIWDQEYHWGGLNHFTLPLCPRGKPTTARYGNVAVHALVRMMISRGSQREKLVAQLFGGGIPEDESIITFGEKNVQVARKVLQREGIRIASEDVGGSLGRKLVFDSKTGQAAVLKVHRLRDSDWRGSERES